MTTLTICIPTYEMNGHGHEFLRYSFDVLNKQTFTDFDIVISDHSKDKKIENLCLEYTGILTIHYYRNTTTYGNSSANTNNAIRKATGSLIKILFQDDFLFSETSLAEIVKQFDMSTDHWLVTACTHTKDGTHFYKEFYPKYNHYIHLGNNTISSPSVLTIKNDHPLLFDETLIWLMDVEYYKRCFITFGPPTILSSITVVNRVGPHQVSNTVATKKIRAKEYLSVLRTYEHGCTFWYYRIIGIIKNILPSL